MSLTKHNTTSSLEIIWAIARNDIVDGFKNRTILSGMGTVLFLILLYKLLPSLYRPTRPHLVFYEATPSAMASALEDSGKYRLQVVSSFDEFTSRFNQGDNGQIGLVSSAREADPGEPAHLVKLDGYVLWANRPSAGELASKLEQELAEIIGQSVRIEIVGTMIPAQDSMGAARSTSITLVVGVFLMALLTVPNLLFEEKRTRTLEALFVSPASIGQVVAAKAVAGLVYCLLVAGISLLLNWVVIVNWALLILAWFWGTLFSVAVGLAMGIHLDSRQQISGWLLVIGNLLLVPVFLSALEPILPEVVRNILPWMPMVAQAILFRYAFSAGASTIQILASLSVLVLAALLMLAFVIWQVRRLDS